MPISKIKSSAIDANAITGAGIADGTVDTADLANGAVTSAKLDTNIDVAGTLDVTGAFTADSTGSVAGTFGIGTTSPGQTLEVNTGNDSNGIRIRRFSGSYYSDIVHTSTPEGLKFMVGNGASVTERLRILGSGGITFNGDTATANALDDYEEGTSSIGISAAAGSGGVVSGGSLTWTKIGNQVIVAGNFSISSLGTLSGTFYITGFPYTASSNFLQSQGAVRSQGIGGSDHIPVVIEMNSGTATARMHFSSGTSTQLTVQSSALSVGDFLAFGLTYQI
jgi:hypothetical protein